MSNINQPQTLQECLELQSHFIVIPKITQKNKREFYRRGKTLQILGVGFLDKGRMPTLEEVEAHIDLTTNAPHLDTKKWNNVLVGILQDMTNKIVSVELMQNKMDREKSYESRNPDSSSS